jgi:hypothetical protein
MKMLNRGKTIKMVFSKPMASFLKTSAIVVIFSVGTVSAQGPVVRPAPPRASFQPVHPIVPIQPTLPDQQLKDLQSIIDTQRAYIEILEKRISDLEKNKDSKDR